MFAGRVEAEFTVPDGEGISVTNNGGVGTVVGITAGSYYHETFAAALQGMLNTQRPGSGGALWTVTCSTTTGKYTIAMSAGTFSITWSSTALRDLLGYTVNIAGAAISTGPSQARGLWLPDCVFRCDIDARRAPMATDHRNTISPTGRVWGLKSTRMARHMNPRWSHVPGERTWEASATTTNASYERFIKDTQLREGHAWFALSSKLRIYDHTGTACGADGPVAAWQVPSLPGLDTLRMAEGIENGLYYMIAWPEIVGAL